MKSLSLVILISGHGSNLQAIMDAIAAKKLNARIKAVISNKETAYGLIRAQNAKIPTHVIPGHAYLNREQYDKALQKYIEKYDPDLIVLAGFMRILSNEFVKHFKGKLINIHPSLLPKYPGLHTHERVLKAGDKLHGACIHFVTEELDAGPVIAYMQLTVGNQDTPETLKERVHQLEHQLYPRVLQLFSLKNIQLKGEQILLNGKILNKNGINLSKLDKSVL